MIYILTIILMLQSEGSDPQQHVITTQWTTQRDCEDTEGVEVTNADTDPDVLGWAIEPHSCEGISVPRKS